jgi:hypothetical protein
MKNRILAVLLTALFMGVASCTHPAQDATPIVRFSSDVRPILTTSCAISTACHVGGANQGINFDSADAYNTIIHKTLVSTANPLSSLLLTVMSQGIMPKAPYAPVPAAQQNLILLWIEQGAQNN